MIIGVRLAYGLRVAGPMLIGRGGSLALRPIRLALVGGAERRAAT